MFSCSCCPCSLIVGAIVLFVFYKLFCSKKCCKKQPEIHEKIYEKDVVYLYQFPRLRTVPNLSPYCLAVEAALKLHKIKYENRYTMRKHSVHGLLPFIELNGEQIADSQLILEKLKKHFNIEPVSQEEETVGRAAARLVSHHTTLLCIKYRMVDEAASAVDYFSEVAGLPEYLYFLKPLGVWLFKVMGKRRVKKVVGLFSDAEFDLLLRKDLDSLKGILGDKKFFHGEKISNTDAAIFGHLATLYYLPKKGHIARVLDEDYPSLVDWANRCKNEFFPDDFEQK